MKNLLFILMAILFSLSARAQFFYYIYSVPDGATVFVNGEQTCVTPCRTKFFWKDNVDGKMTFAVKAPGYEDWGDTLTEKPYKFNLEKTAQMERILPTFKLDPVTAVVGFEKLLVGFEYGDKIGTYSKGKDKIEPINWEGRYRIGEALLSRRFYEILSDQGFQTPFNSKTDLFGTDENEIRTPRFLIGAHIVNFEIRLEQTESFRGDSEIKGVTLVDIDWEVLDKKTNKVVLTHSNKNSDHYRLYYNNIYPDHVRVFENALYDFLRNSGFYDLVNNADVGTEYADSSASISSSHELSITLPSIPKFEKQSDMVKYANPACVTIVTDGGFGSGVVINNAGYVLSAYHVVEDANQIDVKFANGLTLSAEILAFDRANDIVLLDINGSGFPALPVSINTEIPLGEEVITIGTPESVDLGQGIAKGLVSGKRLIDDRVYLQVDFSVSPGNSGAPLLNAQGEIIGIVQSNIVSEGADGVGFAVPMDKVLEMLELKVVVE